ncbi:hypothetical protein MMIC_P1432 [Mariprofundus micogutta]|uniref:Uncharacterized protein n=1 Tax=Mariprofundus micogutta TaxID=1921010 RepID=A0A1L8CNH3_9PROT|nr:hypothetical protein [Mariprofundus micogutta]GAV20466.1 hypothetical protein MMIC_P1432 [Mariprofundus micogutta]
MDDDVVRHSEAPDIDDKAGRHAFHAHAKVQADAESEHEAVSRIRKQHKLKNKKKRKAPKRRFIFWAQSLIILLVCVTLGVGIWAIIATTGKSGGVSWSDELQRGNFDLAARKFSITASAAASQVFESDLSTEAIMQDFNAALPHLRKAGYILTEMEVELGIPPKLIPHFYHDPDVKLDLQKTLKKLGDNNIGSALIMALAEAGTLQKQIEVADMQFNHIEVELGLIPALKLQYKNGIGIQDYIHKD